MILSILPKETLTYLVIMGRGAFGGTHVIIFPDALLFSSNSGELLSVQEEGLLGKGRNS